MHEQQSRHEDAHDADDAQPKRSGDLRHADLQLRGSQGRACARLPAARGEWRVGRGTATAPGRLLGITGVPGEDPVERNGVVIVDAGERARPVGVVLG